MLISVNHLCDKELVVGDCVPGLVVGVWTKGEKFVTGLVTGKQRRGEKQWIVHLI